MIIANSAEGKPSAFFVSRWWCYLEGPPSLRHKEHEGCTEKSNTEVVPEYLQIPKLLSQSDSRHQSDRPGDDVDDAEDLCRGRDRFLLMSNVIDRDCL